MTETTTELDDLRDEVAELRGELRRAMKMLARKSRGTGDASVGRTGGLARQAAQMATSFAADFVVDRGRLLRRPVERAISNHPYGAAALALTAVVMFGRYIVRSSEEDDAATGGG
jgi:hypothetical protein